MSINNLHSLLNGRWFIHEPYGHSLLPSLNSILKGNSIKIEKEDKKPEAFVIPLGKSPVVASTFSNSDNNNDYVLVIDLKNPIYKYSQECGPQGTKSKMSVMDRYKNDPYCKGIVLDIDSGGGQVAGTPEFYDYVREYPKPVVSYTDGLMCSAAYYIGSSSDYIIANKRADHIGSIGAMIYFIDFTGWYEKEGAKVISEYATKSTDKNKDYEELIKGNPQPYIKNQLDPITEDFINDIKKVRAKVNDEVFTGKTYSATDSITMGLVDEIGTLETAIDKVFELAKKSSNQNLNIDMSKQLVKVQAVLGLDAPLASTEEKGSYLNAQQLDALENEFATLESTNTQLQTELDAAKANTDLNDQLTASKETVTAIETSIDTMLTSAGLDVTGTLTEKTAALSAKVEAMGKNDATKPTIIKVGPSTETINEFVDSEASHNQIANSIK
ncbi:protease-4 [Flavobacterium sp. 9]|uniref:S49 family peptidase n=1 Tax=Flavobacterium sp. 9 TaxID=2035198 RepID=UPI000C174AF9|nr:S49 family peptidase [Flavobacterium sp. 9]PIF33004.1 protease-4 [Flavobacterium sp. 9]